MKKIILIAVGFCIGLYIQKTGIIKKLTAKKKPKSNKKTYADIESRKYCDIDYHKENSNGESGS